MNKSLKLAAMLLCLLLLPQSVAAATTTAVLSGVCINELLIDPNGINNFDTDGSGSASDRDEFVELYNTSDTAVDISGWQLWDEGRGNWYTFPGAADSATTVLAAHSYAVVLYSVQIGGALPSMTNPNNLIFDAARSNNGVFNNSGDNVILYDPGANAYIQLIYSGDTAVDPTDFSGIPSTAQRISAVEDWGNHSDGQSLTRYPSGDTAVGRHSTVTPGSSLASPTAVSLQTISVSSDPAIWVITVALLLLAASAYALRRRSAR